jgi:hypothetical protein
MLAPLGALHPKNHPTGPSRPARIPRLTHFFSTDFPPRKSLQNLSSKAHFSKKLPLIWCKYHLTLLSSAYLPQKTRHKNTKKRPKIDLFTPFRSFFGPFWPLFCPSFRSNFSVVFTPKYAASVKTTNRPVLTPIRHLALAAKTEPKGPVSCAPQSHVKRVPAKLCCKSLIFQPLTANPNLPIIYLK